MQQHQQLTQVQQPVSSSHQPNQASINKLLTVNPSRERGRVRGVRGEVRCTLPQYGYGCYINTTSGRKVKNVS